MGHLHLNIHINALVALQIKVDSHIFQPFCLSNRDLLLNILAYFPVYASIPGSLEILATNESSHNTPTLFSRKQQLSLIRKYANTSMKCSLHKQVDDVY